jgi:hypothetical protein
LGIVAAAEIPRVPLFLVAARFCFQVLKHRTALLRRLGLIGAAPTGANAANGGMAVLPDLHQQEAGPDDRQGALPPPEGVG